MMKKKNLKTLRLNKKSISNLEKTAVKGGYESEQGSCYWQDCPSNDPDFMSDCYCPYPGGGGGTNTNNCQTQVNCGSTNSCYWEDCPA
ncbi:hypothetical protein [Kordia zhangzhouensis]|uniref:hypothetical protein n=1 Tax=Kordia zhangzhouensis TaxID=1620405 RepID=UPI0012E00F50|nr:hypothetical protein [Kordia zhangzhouensis]